jgi:RHS repeat-associated protein
VIGSDSSVTSWTYDNTYQLTAEIRSVNNLYAVTYTYDPRGNRATRWDGSTLETLTYDAANQLTAILTTGGSSTYAYDGCGNLVQGFEPGQLNAYTWDGENRMVEAMLSTGVVDTFTYNGDGQRVGKTDQGGPVNYVWDGQNVLIEANASNVIEAVHTLEPAFYGNQLSQRRSGTTSYYHFDALGSTLQLTGSTGTVTDSYLYRAFGDLVASSGATVNPYQYVGRKGYIYDGDLDNFQVRARRYDPTTGRWWSRDPIGFAGGDANLYRYVGNNPLALTDPSGEILPVLALLAVGGLAGANLWIWGNNAIVADDLLNDRPINLNNTPYTLRYAQGLVMSTTVGAGTAAGTPILASVLPGSVSMMGGIGISGYCALREGRTAVTNINAGNYFQGAFHFGTAGLSAYGNYQIGRHYLGPPPMSAQQVQREINRYVGQGYTQAEAQYLAADYVGMGHHFFPRSWKLPLRIQESPFNVMKPTGISRGRFYERHFSADSSFSGTGLRRTMGPWTSERSGLIRPNPLMQALHGLPDVTRGVVASAIVCTRRSPN